MQRYQLRVVFFYLFIFYEKGLCKEISRGFFQDFVKLLFTSFFLVQLRKIIENIALLM